MDINKGKVIGIKSEIKNHRNKQIIEIELEKDDAFLLNWLNKNVKLKKLGLS